MALQDDSTSSPALKALVSMSKKLGVCQGHRDSSFVTEYAHILL